jgi:hypothetical protein
MGVIDASVDDGDDHVGAAARGQAMVRQMLPGGRYLGRIQVPLLANPWIGVKQGGERCRGLRASGPRGHCRLGGSADGLAHIVRLGQFHAGAGGQFLDQGGDVQRRRVRCRCGHPG